MRNCAKCAPRTPCCVLYCVHSTWCSCLAKSCFQKMLQASEWWSLLQNPWSDRVAKKESERGKKHKSKTGTSVLSSAWTASFQMLVRHTGNQWWQWCGDIQAQIQRRGQNAWSRFYKCPMMKFFRIFSCFHFCSDSHHSAWPSGIQHNRRNAHLPPLPCRWSTGSWYHLDKGVHLFTWNSQKKKKCQVSLNAAK